MLATAPARLARATASRKRDEFALTSYHPAARALCVWSLSQSLSLGAVAVARRLWRRCVWRRAGAPGAVSVVPPRSRRRGARPPLPRRRLALGARVAWCSTAPATAGGAQDTIRSINSTPCPGPGLRVQSARRGNVWHRREAVSVVPPLSRRRDLGRRFRGGGSLSARTVRGPRQPDLSARDRWRGRFSLGRSPLRGAHGAADCGAALALLAPSQFCRRVAAA